MSEPGARLEIDPDPSPEEREAILAALSELVEPPRNGLGDGWRRAGLPAADEGEGL